MKRRVSISMIALAAAQLAGPSWAQTPAPAQADAAEDDQLRDIIVTAQRREQRLQDVPVAVTAVSGATLTRSGSADVTDLSIAVPSLKITNNNGQIAPRLRGIGSTATGPGVENSVAVYVDGVYFGSSVASLLALNNIERVEVLKGPQGTLFGRNSTGGLLQIITRTPRQEPTLEFNITGANYRSVTANAYLSGGLSNTIAMDLAVQYTHQGDGWGVNRGTGNPAYDVDHDFAARSKIVFEPSSATRFTLTGDYASTNNSLNAGTLLPGTRAFPTGAAAADIDYDTNTSRDFVTSGWQAGGSLKIEQDVGQMALSSITAYRKSRYRRAFDFDVTTNPLPNPTPGIPYRYFDLSQPDDQFSQELQLASKGSGTFTWVLGAFYYDASASYDPASFLFEAPFGPVAPQGQRVLITSKVKTESLAGYGQGTLALGEATNLMLGARYTHETKSILGSQVRFLVPSNAPAPIGGFAPQPELSVDKLSLRASLDHHFTPDTMVYASFNRGFKSGGFSAAAPADPSYLPEEIDAYEVGVKTELFDRRLRVNMAGFHYRYTNIQIQTVGGAGTFTTNGPSAKITGFDLDFDARVSRALRVSGGLQLVDDRFGVYNNALIGNPLGGVNQTLGSATGNRLPNATRTTFSVTPVYTVDLPNDGNLEFAGTYYYNSGWFPEADNVFRQPSFSQYNASVRWTVDRHFSLSLWGKNLSDERTIASKATLPGGRNLVIWGPPRTYGVTVGAKF